MLGGATCNSAAAGGAAVRASLTLRQEVGQSLPVALQPGGVESDRLERLLNAPLGARVRVFAEELLHLDGALLRAEVIRQRLDQLR